MKNVIGIDLGTTNCCVAVVENGRPKVIEDEKGYNILPSYIALKGSNKFVVGHGAKAQAISNPANTLRTVKRLIGRKLNTPEVEDARKRVGFDIVEGPNQEVLLRIGEVTLSPVDASSILLKCIKGIAEKHLGREVTEAVITCPAYFTNAQRKATIEAGQKAGLRVLRLLNEPTAAALAYGYRKDVNKKILIYDLGGGTFDVSILEIGNNVYEVLATNGDSYLGGEDFDNRVVDYLAANFKTQHRVDLRQDRVGLQRLKDAAERAKCELSFVDKTQIMIPHVHGTVNLQAEMSRETLEKLVEDLVQKTVSVVNKTLEEANLKPSDIEDVILVGGQTRMPRVHEVMKSYFGKVPSKGVHPDEAVAIGAAVQAAALTEDKGEILLLDVTPFSLGIDSAGDVFTRIVGKNSVIPVSENRTFTTVMDNQEKVKIVVRQGESKKASENSFLGEFVLNGIRRAPKMEPKIDVTFRIDFNGILNVSAKDRFTGERQSIMIKDYFERASNPNYEGAPAMVAESPVKSGDAPPEVPDVAAEGAPTGGLFSRLVGRFGRKKEAAPEVGPDLGVDSGAGIPGVVPVDPEPVAPGVPDPGRPGSDFTGAGFPGSTFGATAAPAASFYGDAPTAATNRALNDSMPPPSFNPGEPPAAPAPGSAGGSWRTTPPPTAPTWDTDPFNHLPQSRPFSGQYTDPFGQKLPTTTLSSPDPYAVPPQAESKSAAFDPFGIVEKGAPGVPSPLPGGPNALREPEPFGGEPRTASRPPSSIDPFGIVEKPGATKAPDPFARSVGGRDPFNFESTDPFDRGGRGASAGAGNDLLGLDIDKLVDELAEGIPTVSTPLSSLGASRTSRPTSLTDNPLSGWQAPANMGSGLDDSMGLGGGADIFALSEPTAASFGRTAERPIPSAGAGIPSSLGSGSTGIRASSMHRGTADRGAGGLPEESNLPTGFLDERPSLPSGFVPEGSSSPAADPSFGPQPALDERLLKSDGSKKKPARLKIAYKRTDAFVNEYGENLSRGGTFIKTPSPLDLGRECVFELSIPNRDMPILLKGVVVWSSKGAVQLEAGQEAGMGIKYVFDESSSKRDLERILNDLRMGL